MALTAEQKNLIKATVPILETQGELITKTFYRNMLAENPELNNIFNSANQLHNKQPRALANAVLAYAKHIDNPAVLMPVIELIAHKHVSLLVRADQYSIVGRYLLAAMGQVLGDALTQDIVDAWTVAYGELADIFIKFEQDLYNQCEGWTDWRDFRIAKKVKENEEITSFYFAPVDGKALPAFKPGQYTTVMVDVPSLNHQQCRQYSLSQAPLSDYYRISVKREPGLDTSDPASAKAPGLVSNLLHDTKHEGDIVKLSHPMGDFFLDSLDPAEKKPLVLISGGIGLTPLNSILEYLAFRSAQRPITWVHAARTADVRAFAKNIDSIAQREKNVRAVFFNDQPSQTADQVGSSIPQHAGKLDLSKLDSQKDLYVHDPSAEYYVCGPTGFMLDVDRALANYGVDQSRVKMELFGTGGVVRATA